MMLYGLPSIVESAAAIAANTPAATVAGPATAPTTTTTPTAKEDDVMFMRAVCELLT